MACPISGIPCALPLAGEPVLSSRSILCRYTRINVHTHTHTRAQTEDKKNIPYVSKIQPKYSNTGDDSIT